MAIGRYAGIAGIEDFISAGDSPDYYDMYLNAGALQEKLNNLALESEGKMASNAINALGGYFQGMGEAALAKAQYGQETPNTFNQVLGAGADFAGLAGSFGGGNAEMGRIISGDQAVPGTLSIPGAAPKTFLTSIG